MEAYTGHVLNSDSQWGGGEPGSVFRGGWGETALGQTWRGGRVARRERHGPGLPSQTAEPAPLSAHAAAAPPGLPAPLTALPLARAPARSAAGAPAQLRRGPRCAFPRSSVPLFPSVALVSRGARIPAGSAIAVTASAKPAGGSLPRLH